MQIGKYQSILLSSMSLIDLSGIAWYFPISIWLLTAVIQGITAKCTSAPGAARRCVSPPWEYK